MDPDPITELKERQARLEKENARLRNLTRVFMGVVVASVAGVLLYEHSLRSSPPPDGRAPVGRATPPAVAAPAPAHGPTWTRVALPAAAALDAVSSGAGATFAVGKGGTILRAPAGGAWAAQPSGTRADLHGVAQQAGRAVAVGDHGTVVELSGSTWKPAPPVADVTLRAVAYSSYGVLAVGDGGTILVDLDGTWTRDQSGTTADLFGVCAGLREAYAVGAGGTILRREAFAWKRVEVPTRADLLGVACDDAKAIAVGRGGVVVRRNDPASPFKLVASGAGHDLEAVSSPSYTPSYLAVGAGGLVVRAVTDYAASPSGVRGDLHAVVEGPTGTFAAGDDGLFRRGT